MRRFFWIGVGVCFGIFCWPWWSPSALSLQLGIIAFVVIILICREHWASEISICLIAFLIGSLRCSSIASPVVPEEGSIVGEVRNSKGRRAIIESEQGRIDIEFYPEAPPKEALIAVWYQLRQADISWPGGVNYQQRAERIRAPVRRAKDWRLLSSPAIPTKPSSFSDMKYGDVLWAFASGQRAEIEMTILQLMRETGTSHLLAISGMHIGLVSALGYALSRLLLSPFILIGGSRIPTKFPLLVAMGIAIWYGDMVGWPSSAKRAVIMVVLLSMGKLVDVDISLWDLLGIAATIILLREPAEIHSLSFQLSFSAVIGILWITPIFQGVLSNKKHQLWKKIVLSLGVTLGAMLGTLPICGWLFQQIAWISPLSNLLVSPLMGGVAVPLALLAAICDGWVANLLLCFGDAAIEVSVFLLELLRTPPLTIAFSLWQAVVASVLVIALRWNKVFAILFLPLCWNSSSVPEQFEAHFLSIGQGDSTLIRWPDGRDWLIDAGPFSFELVPYLRREGIWQLDKVILSHPHPDHLDSLLLVIEDLSVDEFVSLRPPHENEKRYQKLWNLLLEKQINIRLAEDFKEPGVIIHHPLNGWTTSKRTVNEQSLVLEIQYDEHRFLFTGDIEQEAEHHLQGKIGKIDVLKVPHHGSKTSSSKRWIEELQPEISVISCGKDNRYGHPHAETLEALRSSVIFRTDEQGIISVISDGKSLKTALNP